ARATESWGRLRRGPPGPPPMKCCSWALLIALAASRLHLEWWVGKLAERFGRVERFDTRGRQQKAPALVQANRVLVDPPALPNVRVIGAHAVEGALLERHARARGAFLAGERDARLAAEAGTEIRSAGRHRIVDHDPGHVALSLHLEPHAHDVSAAP